MKKRKDPQQSWEDKVLDFCTKIIIPVVCCGELLDVLQ